jgi:aquaporin Z
LTLRRLKPARYNDMEIAAGRTHMESSMNTPTRHWPEYLMEVAGLGAFMVSAAAMTTVLEHPASPVRELLASSPVIRRALMGLAMGLTSAALVYLPWGRRSGAHLNPAVTLTFLRLGKISRRDAVWYGCAQFGGGVLGIAIAALILGQWISHPAVNYVVTAPGTFGARVAFIAEASISFLLMFVILSSSNHARIARFTGVIVVGAMWRGLWIYFLAPPLGMLAAAEVYLRARSGRSIRCAKLHHDDGPCIFGCGGQVHVT